MKYVVILNELICPFFFLGKRKCALFGCVGLCWNQLGGLEQMVLGMEACPWDRAGT